MHQCPSCAEISLKRTTRILEPPTISDPVKRRLVEKCDRCGYANEVEETIAQVDPDPSMWMIDTSSYWLSGSADSSSDFGGGDSGGGGDGGSW